MSESTSSVQIEERDQADVQSETPVLPKTRSQTASLPQKPSNQPKFPLPSYLVGVLSEEKWNSFSLAKQKICMRILKSPNSFYFRFRPPWEETKVGPFSKEEEAMFYRRMDYFQKTLGIKNALWGYFAIPFIGRVGYQLSTFYRNQVKTGKIKDEDYSKDDKGDLKSTRPRSKHEIPEPLSKKLTDEAYNFILNQIEGLDIKDEDIGDDYTIGKRPRKQRSYSDNDFTADEKDFNDDNLDNPDDPFVQGHPNEHGSKSAKDGSAQKDNSAQKSENASGSAENGGSSNSNTERSQNQAGNSHSNQNADSEIRQSASETADSSKQEAAAPAQQNPAPRKRGRPRKNPIDPNAPKPQPARPKADGNNDEESDFSGLVSRIRSRHHHSQKKNVDYDSDEEGCPLVGGMDPVSHRPMRNPAVNQEGYVLDYDSWTRVLNGTARMPFDTNIHNLNELRVLNRRNYNELRMTFINFNPI
ncbi:AT hook motif family protein [Trichomonas vaginalis G3]|uniref:AT hook motif family protein n=1 Tax=Trichomonas vaginalis (strain ATCC PRA-98 / G3) TaxID=412133 RepID=A2ENX3_TRIV3|nr:hypothetical protein TVAGG3_0249570 [Trichomonas vaginalis G3]EAY05663.1 AT hook motif family protein [Trichomonas vaginalis G3]KAI5553903.1 hypothetical protein TVAGG3_0249570 [Trichomonas vaginalis G3]|eukprot:XP_001317886.1 AT hook motif family protein [Trichomonas vaginalis G3]